MVVCCLRAAKLPEFQPKEKEKLSDAIFENVKAIDVNTCFEGAQSSTSSHGMCRILMATSISQNGAYQGGVFL